MRRRVILAPMRPSPVTPICMALSSSPLHMLRQHGNSLITSPFNRGQIGYSLGHRLAPMQDPAMTHTDIAYTSAAELARMIRAKQISATEVVRAALARAEAVQAVCNCFITICGDQALTDAAAADQAVAKAAEVGP